MPTHSLEPESYGGSIRRVCGEAPAEFNVAQPVHVDEEVARSFVEWDLGAGIAGSEEVEGCGLGGRSLFAGPTRPAVVEGMKDMIIRGGAWVLLAAANVSSSSILHGFPIGHSPADALDVVGRSGVRQFAIGNRVVSKDG